MFCLFQLLTGVLPLRGDSMAALMYQIANTPAPSVREIRPELPQDLADILAKTLAKSPSERYQTGAEIAAAPRAVQGTPMAATDTPQAFQRTQAMNAQRDESAMLATVVTPPPVSSTESQNSGFDIRL